MFEAAVDLKEAILIASDGNIQVPIEVLEKTVDLLVHGTDGGNFFNDFKFAFLD